MVLKMLRYCILCTVIWFGWAGFCEEPVRADDAPASPVQQLLERLSSVDYSIRQQARKSLRDVPLEQLPELVDGLSEPSAESCVLRVRILEEIMLSDTGSRGELAEQGLEYLSLQDGPLGAAAKSTLIRNSQLRESRARLAIERLGGAVTYRNPNSPEAMMARPALPDAPGTGVGFGPPAIPWSIWLHDSWKGKPEDLWHLRRFSRWTGLVVYVIKGSGVDANDVRMLTGWLPGMVVQERGASLGIRAGVDQDSCEIREVMPGSPADRASLAVGDRILTADGRRIRSFYDLVSFLTEKSPRDTVDFEVLRAGDAGQNIRQFKVTLGSWRTHEDPDRVAPPPDFAGPQGTSYLLLHDRPPQVPMPEPQRIEGILR